MNTSRLSSLGLAIFAVAFSTGCNPAAKAIGTWEVETDKFQAQLPLTGDNAAAAVLAGMSKLLQVRAELEIKADSTWRQEVSVAGNSQSSSGTWRYVKSEGDTLVLAAKSAGGDEQEFKLKFIDNDHIEASGMMANQSFPLRRKKAN